MCPGERDRAVILHQNDAGQGPPQAVGSFRWHVPPVRLLRGGVPRCIRIAWL